MYIITKLTKEHWKSIEELSEKAEYIAPHFSEASKRDAICIIENSNVVFAMTEDYSYIALDEKWYKLGFKIYFFIFENLVTSIYSYTKLYEKNFIKTWRINMRRVNACGFNDYISTIENMGLGMVSMSYADKDEEFCFVLENNFSESDLVDKAIYSKSVDILYDHEMSFAGLSLIKELFEEYEKYGFNPENLMDKRDYIIEKLVILNLDRLNTLGENIEARFYNQVEIGHKAAEKGTVEKFVKRLEENGYKRSDSVSEKSDEKGFTNYDKTYSVYSNTVYFEHSKLYDDKYKENTLTYYRHVIKRHVRKDMGPYTRHVALKTLFGNKIIVTKHSGNIPYLTKARFKREYQINHIAFKIKSGLKTNEEKQEYDHFINHYVKLITKHLIKRFKEEEVYEILQNNLDWEDSRLAHDIAYKWLALFDGYNGYFTNKAVKTLLKKDVGSLEYHLKQLDRIPRNNRVDHKSLRKTLSAAVKKGLDIKDIVDEQVDKSLKIFLKRKNISSIEMVNEFIGKMNVYNSSVNIERFFEILKGNGKKVIEGKIEGLFEPEVIYPDMSGFSVVINEALKIRTKKAKKIYSKLREIHPIKELMNGHIPYEGASKIVDVLKTYGYEVKMSNLPLFYGKIEPKCSPEYLVAGDASKCCMGFGEQKATTYALEKGFGIFNIYYKGLVIANSVLWIDKKLNVLVIDNIEVNDNYLKYEDHLRNLYSKMHQQLVIKYKLDGVVQGGRYNDIELYENQGMLVKTSGIAVDVTGSFYTDADVAYVIDSTSDLSKFKTTGQGFRGFYYEDDEDDCVNLEFIALGA